MIDVASNGIELLKNIRTVMYNFQSQKYGPMALHESKRQFYVILQDKHMTVTVYLERFQNGVEVIKHCGGTIGVDPGPVDATMSVTTPVMSRATAAAVQLLAAVPSVRLPSNGSRLTSIWKTDQRLGKQLHAKAR
jgi:hypothetical protein